MVSCLDNYSFKVLRLSDESFFFIVSLREFFVSLRNPRYALILAFTEFTASIRSWKSKANREGISRIDRLSHMLEMLRSGLSP
jgi:hypothetical protein